MAVLSLSQTHAPRLDVQCLPGVFRHRYGGGGTPKHTPNSPPSSETEAQTDRAVTIDKVLHGAYVSILFCFVAGCVRVCSVFASRKSFSILFAFYFSLGECAGADTR